MSSEEGLTVEMVAEIAPPPRTAATVAMKQNIFEQLRSSNTALLPLFPYDGPGAIVPCISAFRSRPGVKFGAFQHENTVDEIMLVYGSEGTPLRAGQVMVGARKHHVSINFVEPANVDQFIVMTVTQRQSEDPATQIETLTFFCEQCQEPLHVSRYPATAHRDRDLAAVGYVSPSVTVLHTAAAARETARDEIRTCSACGHVNAPFPYEYWGWGRYDDQTYCAQSALRSLLGLAPPAQPETTSAE